MQRPGVLILASDARDYIPLLADLAGGGIELTAAANAAEARARYSGQPVVLGQPDLVAASLEWMPQVRWVQSTWAGVSPVLAQARRDFVLTGVKNAFGLQMAEYVLAYLLAHELKMFERLGRQANRDWWDEPSGSLKGKILGVMGTGSIGSHIARILKPFGMRTVGLNRSGAQGGVFDEIYPVSQMEEFLAGPDYLVCVLPDTPATTSLLDAKAFGAMKNSCYLLNVGRGKLIDEEALADALYAGELAGAVLDVFRDEPLPTDSRLWNAPGLIVTGHVAASSWPEDIARIFSENYRRYCENEPLNYRIDFDRGY